MVCFWPCCALGSMVGGLFCRLSTVAISKIREWIPFAALRVDNVMRRESRRSSSLWCFLSFGSGK